MSQTSSHAMPARHPVPSVTGHPGLWQGVYRLADPKITLASAAGLLLGAAAAAHDGPIAWGWLFLTALGIFFLEAAKNASGEVFDWDSGDDAAVAPEDRSPFSGGKRVIVDGLMTRRQTIVTALVFYAAGGLCGLSIVALREPKVLWLGALGVALAFFYHAPPVKLAYRGFGELAVAAVYGPLIACGTYLVQRHAVGTSVGLLSIPLGLLVAAFLLINEFPDARADEGAGKKTLVVRLGRRAGAHLFRLVVWSAFVLLAVMPLLGLPVTVWFAVLGLPFAVSAARRLAVRPEVTREIVPAQGWTLVSFLLFAIGAAVGLLVAAM